MVVFLLLGVIWAAVLVPPWLQARREARPIASIMSFRSQLWSLQAATPVYGDTSYGDAYADTYDTGTYAVDTYDTHVYDTGEVAAVHSFADARRAADRATPGSAAPGAIAPAVVGTVVRSAEQGAPRGISLAAASSARRAQAFRRRRQVLTLLFLLTGGLSAPAVLVGGPWVVAAVGAGTLLAAYVGLLVQHGRREVERAQKVRYLTPIRAPRPSVVVIGSGAAR